MAITRSLSDAEFSHERSPCKYSQPTLLSILVEWDEKGPDAPDRICVAHKKVALVKRNLSLPSENAARESAVVSNRRTDTEDTS